MGGHSWKWVGMKEHFMAQGLNTILQPKQGVLGWSQVQYRRQSFTSGFAWASTTLITKSFTLNDMGKALLFSPKSGD
jgi:hypothetical protein